MKEKKFEFMHAGQKMVGKLVSFIELNKLACDGERLLYCMNMLSDDNKVFMVFRDENSENYFVLLRA